MTNIAKRIEELRTEKALSRPALSEALGLPKTAIEKFETGRQTPSLEQQQKIAEFFGVTVEYLRGESGGTASWLSEEPEDVPVSAPVSARAVRQNAVGGDTAVFSALLRSEAFRALVRESVLDVLRSKEGQELLARAVRREMK